MYRDRPSPLLPVLLLLPLLALAVGAVFQIARPLPGIEASLTVPPSTVLGEETSLQLPAEGGTVVAVTGIGVVGSNELSAPRPIASVAKVMAAFVILRDHPLGPEDDGPLISISQEDESRYLQMLAEDQSVLPVAAGLQFSLREMLEGLLIPSANNFAEILARWDAGSTAAFVQKMNTEAQELGMLDTRYADVSGLQPATASTPGDQLLLMRQALKDPVFAAIVASESVDLPNIGSVPSTNELLGTAGVAGIKTGYTEEAGGNLTFLARWPIGSQQGEVIGGVFGQGDRPQAFDEVASIVAQVAETLQPATVLSAGQAVASLTVDWATPVPVVVQTDASLLVWPGATLSTEIEYSQLALPLSAGQEVGSITLRLGEQEITLPVFTAEALSKPGILWRLGRF